MINFNRSLSLELNLQSYLLFRSSPPHFFDAFVEVAAPDPTNPDSTPWVLQTYPANYKEKEQDKLKSVPQFVFPCKLEM